MPTFEPLEGDVVLRDQATPALEGILARADAAADRMDAFGRSVETVNAALQRMGGGAAQLSASIANLDRLTAAMESIDAERISAFGASASSLAETLQIIGLYAGDTTASMDGLQAAIDATARKAEEADLRLASLQAKLAVLKQVDDAGGGGGIVQQANMAPPQFTAMTQSADEAERLQEAVEQVDAAKLSADAPAVADLAANMNAVTADTQRAAVAADALAGAIEDVGESGSKIPDELRSKLDALDSQLDAAKAGVEATETKFAQDNRPAGEQQSQQDAMARTVIGTLVQRQVAQYDPTGGMLSGAAGNLAASISPKVLMGVGAAAGVAAAGVAAVVIGFNKMTEAMEAADRKARAFDKLNRQFGDTAAAIDLVKEKIDGIASEDQILVAFQGIDKTSVLNDVDTLATIAEIAKENAYELGVSWQEAMQQITSAIQSGDFSALEKMGLVENGEQALLKYAASIGKLVPQLNQFERQQALTNSVVDEFDASLGAVTSPSEELNNAYAAMDATLKNVNATFADWIVSMIDPGAKSAIEWWKDAINDEVEGASEMAQTMSDWASMNRIMADSSISEEDKGYYVALVEQEKAARDEYDRLMDSKPDGMSDDDWLEQSQAAQVAAGLWKDAADRVAEARQKLAAGDTLQDQPQFVDPVVQQKKYELLQLETQKKELEQQAASGSGYQKQRLQPMIDAQQLLIDAKKAEIDALEKTAAAGTQTEMEKSAAAYATVTPAVIALADALERLNKLQDARRNMEASGANLPREAYTEIDAQIEAAREDARTILRDNPTEDFSAENITRVQAMDDVARANALMGISAPAQNPAVQEVFDNVAATSPAEPIDAVTQSLVELTNVAGVAFDKLTGLPVAFDATKLSGEQLTQMAVALADSLEKIEFQSINQGLAMGAKLAPSMGAQDAYAVGQDFMAERADMFDRLQESMQIDPETLIPARPLDPSVANAFSSALEQSQQEVAGALTAEANAREELERAVASGDSLRQEEAAATLELAQAKRELAEAANAVTKATLDEQIATIEGNQAKIAAASTEREAAMARYADAERGVETSVDNSAQIEALVAWKRALEDVDKAIAANNQMLLSSATAAAESAQERYLITLANDELAASMSELTAVGNLLIDPITNMPVAFSAMAIGAGQADAVIRQLAASMQQLEFQAVSSSIAMASRLVPSLGVAGAYDVGLGFGQEHQALSQQFQAGNEARIARGQMPIDQSVYKQFYESALTANQQARITDQLSEIGGAAGGAVDALDRVKGAIESLASGLTKDTTKGLIPLDEMLPREDEIDEKARQMADVAVKGFQSPWFEGLKDMFPEDVLAEGESAVKTAAAQMVKDHQDGVTMMFYDTEKAAEQVLEKIKGQVEQQKYLEEVYGKVREQAEAQGLSMQDVADMLGIEAVGGGGGGRTSAVENTQSYEELQEELDAQMNEDGTPITEDEASPVTPEDQKDSNQVFLPLVQQMTPDEEAMSAAEEGSVALINAAGEAMVTQASTGDYGGRAMDTILAQLTAAQKDVEDGGKKMADWFGDSFKTRLEEAIPAGLLNILVSELVPLLAAAASANDEGEGGGGEV
jgi:hypothetical protein